MNNIIIWHDGAIASDPYMGHVATPVRNNIALFTGSFVTPTAFLFDVRVMDEAISESGGTAAEADDLGAVTYMFKDMTDNNGQVHLPFG